jgi:hypothetical protein
VYSWKILYTLLESSLSVYEMTHIAKVLEIIGNLIKTGKMQLR